MRFPQRCNLRAQLDRYEARIASETWSVPEEIYQQSLSDLRDRTLRQYGNLGREIEETNRFVFDVAYFDS